MINKVILMGRLVADPELKQTTSNIAVCKFTIAINRPFVSKDGGEKQSDFVIPKEETSDFENWELVDYVENVYNRCVIFNAKRFHSATQYFGTTPENSRLFQVFFFNKK